MARGATPPAPEKCTAVNSQSRVCRTTGHGKPSKHRSSGSSSTYANTNEILFSSGSIKKYVKAHQQHVAKTICGAPLKVYSKKSVQRRACDLVMVAPAAQASRCSAIDRRLDYQRNSGKVPLQHGGYGGGEKTSAHSFNH